MPETTPLIKAALNLRVGAGFDVYEKCKYGKVLKNFLIKLFDKAGKSARFLAQKNRKPFLISCHGMPL